MITGGSGLGIPRKSHDIGRTHWHYRSLKPARRKRSQRRQRHGTQDPRINLEARGRGRGNLIVVHHAILQSDMTVGIRRILIGVLDVQIVHHVKWPVGTQRMLDRKPGSPDGTPAQIHIAVAGNRRQQGQTIGRTGSALRQPGVAIHRQGLQPVKRGVIGGHPVGVRLAIRHRRIQKRQAKTTVRDQLVVGITRPGRLAFHIELPSRLVDDIRIGEVSFRHLPLHQHHAVVSRGIG